MGINELLLSSENILVIANRDDLIAFAEKYAELILFGKEKTPEKVETERPISQTEAVQFLGKSRQTLVPREKRDNKRIPVGWVPLFYAIRASSIT